MMTVSYVVFYHLHFFFVSQSCFLFITTLVHHLRPHTRSPLTHVRRHVGTSLLLKNLDSKKNKPFTIKIFRGCGALPY